ncbi:hypothetical protein D3C72_1383070 [compost metagenome]
MARNVAGKVAISHALADGHRLVQRTQDVRAEKTQRGRKHQDQQRDRHAALPPQRAVEGRVNIVHVQTGEHQPAPFRLVGRVADLGQRIVGARPRKQVLDIAPARLALRVEVFKDGLPFAVLDRPHVRSHQPGVGMHKQGVVVAERADVAILPIAQLRQPARDIALGVRQRHALLHALLAVAHNPRGQVQDVAQLDLAFGHHLRAPLPRIPGPQSQHGRADGKHEPQQFPTQAGITHRLSSACHPQLKPKTAECDVLYTSADEHTDFKHRFHQGCVVNLI